MQFLVQTKSTSPIFVSTSYVGELVKREGGIIELAKVCTVHEMMFQSKTGDMDVKMTFFTSNLLSNGIVQFKEEDLKLTREVADDDLLLDGCKEAHEAFRSSKAGLVKPVGTRPVQRV